jgi:hypothetical protein
MIGTNADNGYGPFGSTSRAAGPKRFSGGMSVHENPRPTEEEQRNGYAPAEAADEDEE